MEVWKAVIAAAVQQAGFPAPLSEARFCQRKWRFDLFWPSQMVAFEREGFAPGGGQGRHQRVKGMSNDCEKYNAAAIAGIIVIRGTPPMLESGKVLDAIIAALKARTKK